MAASHRRHFGDRREGRRIRTLEPFYNFIPFIMPTRNDATNYFEGSIEVTDIDRWLRTKRLEGYKGMGMLHVFIAAYIRTCSQYPGINRFIAGQRIFARNNIEVVFTVKRALTLEAPETTVKMEFDPSDTVYDVYRKVNDKVEEIKANDGENNTEQVAGALCALPRPILNLALWLIKRLDYHGLLPKFVMDASPFHGSMIITDLASLGIGPIYHHIYNFGTLPVFIAIGAKRKEVGVNSQGQLVTRKFMDYKVSTDERTVDGMYYASAFKYIKNCLANPAILEDAPASVKEDID